MSACDNVYSGMGQFLDSIPFSGIIRIRDMMYGVKDPFRLDQGDVSFDAPIRSRPRCAARSTRTGATICRPRDAAATGTVRRKLRAQRHPSRLARRSDGHDGGIHGLYILCQGLLEPGDEVIVPDPGMAARVGNIPLAPACRCLPAVRALGWRYDLDELASKITPKTRAIFINSPHNPTGGVLTRAELEAIARSSANAHLWVISDEAYEDVVYDGGSTSTLASRGNVRADDLVVHLSKSYAMTGLRLGYVAVEGCECATA